MKRMNTNILTSRWFLPYVIVLTCFAAWPPCANAKRQQWKAGVASVVITPEKSMWMAGYAARKAPSEGKVHDLWAKALALED
ncbi:MAG: neutral/alkaline non-lysosomal ceramidase N-terminal domain-containing protein, partial [Planctomycetota bacterium]